jgi:hypothetical protein
MVHHGMAHAQPTNQEETFPTVDVKHALIVFKLI